MRSPLSSDIALLLLQTAPTRLDDDDLTRLVGLLDEETAKALFISLMEEVRYAE